MAADRTSNHPRRDERARAADRTPNAPRRDGMVRALQRRIDAALAEPPAVHAASGHSDYLPEPADRLARRLVQAAAGSEGAAAIEAAFDEHDRLDAAGEDPLALRRALAVLLTHHPAAVALGLRVPDLAERAPWLTVPSKR